VEAVKHAMERDGVRPSDCCGSLFRGEREETSPSERAKTDDLRRTRVHWDKLDVVSRNSVWALVVDDPDVDRIVIDEAEFAELFQRKEQLPSSSLGPRLRSSTTGESSVCPRQDVAVKVIDPKRANNGGIILARVKMSYDDISRSVDNLDETALSAEQVQGLMEYIPTSKEKESLLSYLESSSSKHSGLKGLCECEKFMMSLMNVSHPLKKMKAMLFMIQCKSLVAELETDLSIIESACEELRHSVCLRKILGIILRIGNRLNTAGQSRERAAGFSLGSLLKLHVKAVGDRNTTILQYVVSIIERNDPQLLLALKNGLPSVLPASRILWEQCLDQLTTLEGQVDNVKEIALCQAQVLRQGTDVLESIVLDIARNGGVLSDKQMRQLESTKVGSFALSAIESIAQLRGKAERAQRKFSCLLDYFGEEAIMMPNDLCHIVLCFMKDVKDAHTVILKAIPSKIADNHDPLRETGNGLAHAYELGSQAAKGQKPPFDTVHSKVSKNRKGKFSWKKRKDLLL